MDATVAALKTEIESFIAAATAAIEAGKTAAAAALAKAVADAGAVRDVDLKALQAEVAAAHATIAVPAFEPSNQ